MANFGIYAQADITSLKVGDTSSPTTYSEIQKSQSYALNGDANDEVKLTFPSTQNINAIAITGLNSYPTITVKKTLSAIETTIGTISGSTYAAEARARQTFNALLLVADTDADDIKITFGTPRPTGFRTVMAGELIFQPDENFQQGVNFTELSEFDEMETRSSNYGQLRSRKRVFEPNLQGLSDAEFEQIDFVKYKVADRNCLVVLDTDNVHPSRWMIARISGGESSLVGSNRNIHSIEFTEANKWL
jgi:hypothetical protein